MKLGESLYKELTATATINAYTSNRVYPGVAAQDAKTPYITYSQMSRPPIHAMGNDAKLTYPRVEISFWATSYSGMENVAEAARDHLTNYSGLLGDATSGISVQNMFFEGQVDIIEVNQETNEVLYRRAQDYIIWHTT